MTKVFVLKMENFSWVEIDSDNLDLMLSEGNIKNGDVIIFPQKAMVAKSIIVLENVKNE